MKHLQYFFKKKIEKICETSWSFEEYKNHIRGKTPLYVKIADNNQIVVEWKIGKGIYIIAIITFTLNSPHNLVKIQSYSKSMFFLQVIAVFWLVMASFWLVAIPDASTVWSVLFGTGIIVGLWEAIVINRHRLITYLSPKDI